MRVVAATFHGGLILMANILDRPFDGQGHAISGHMAQWRRLRSNLPWRRARFGPVDYNTPPPVDADAVGAECRRRIYAIASNVRR